MFNPYTLEWEKPAILETIRLFFGIYIKRIFKLHFQFELLITAKNHEANKIFSTYKKIVHTLQKQNPRKSHLSNTLHKV